MASLVALKKSSSDLPAGPNLPNAVPNTTLNITTPSTFVVAVFTGLKFHRCNGTIIEMDGFRREILIFVENCLNMNKEID